MERISKAPQRGQSGHRSHSDRWGFKVACRCAKLWEGHSSINSVDDFPRQPAFMWLSLVFNILLHSALETLSGAELFPALGLRSKGEKEELQKSPDVFAHFLRLSAFHIDGQLHFTDITFGWQHSHYTRQLSALSTLSSIISDSFEFLLAASMHKFHKR